MAYGTQFGAAAAAYDAARPGYPDVVVEALRELAGDRPVLDLGAGTGKLSAALLAAGLDVSAVDPDEKLLALNPALHQLGRAEAIPADDDTYGLVTVAQAWHWFDEAAAAAEIRRVLRPGGAVAILINQLDVRADWVLRLSRIMHAGDVYRPHWRPKLPGFGTVQVDVCEFSVPMTVEGVIALAATRTYWLRSNEAVRRRVEGNLREYLSVECPMPQTFKLPYLCISAIAHANGPDRT